MELTEKQIERQILQYLYLLNGCYAWKEDGQGVIVGAGEKKRMLKVAGKYRAKGKSDILGCYQGRFFAIEVKKPGGRVSDHQKLFIENIRSVGGFACVAYSLDDARKFMEDMKDQIKTNIKDFYGKNSF